MMLLNNKYKLIQNQIFRLIKNNRINYLMSTSSEQQIQRGAERLNGFDKPTVWSIFSPLSVEYKSVNLGQGFPNWNPPDFFMDSLLKLSKEGPHQYTRAFGSPKLVKAIADFYSPIFNRQLDANTNVCVSAGGVSCLNSIFLGLVNPGEEVILLDPSYDCYRAQIQMAGGISKSVPLRPRKLNSQTDIRQRGPVYTVNASDAWDVDFELLEKTINDNTKILLINTPHNPTGKVFNRQELERIHEIVKKYPKCIVVEDGVYEHLCFDNYEPLKLPRFAQLEGAWDRTVSVYSAGKLYSATGIRMGWAVGPQSIIKYVQSFHQYSVFCQHGPMQDATAEALELSSKSSYFAETAQKLKNHRDLLINQLVNSKIPFKIWVPEGGFFVICDISQVEVDPKYFVDEKTGEKYTKDYAFSIWLCKEKGVTAIPCSVFYPPEYQYLGQNLVRFAFCKTEDTILEAGKRLNN
ncbi:hypothetical protein ABPG72_000269 [Tetrahymena utriculariae]